MTQDDATDSNAVTDSGLTLEDDDDKEKDDDDDGTGGVHLGTSVLIRRESG